MKYVKKILLPTLVFLLFLTIFRGWLSSGVLSSGDWPYLYKSAVAQLTPFSTWDMVFSNGMGQSSLPKIWFDSYALTIVKLANVLSWPLFERAIWFFPYILLSFGASYLLAGKYKLGFIYRLLAGVIYSLNTYILLIVSGGQVGIFMAYAFFPIVLYAFYYLTEHFSLKRALLYGMSLALIVMLDLRVGYMAFAFTFLFGILYLLCNSKNIVSKIAYLYIAPSIIIFLLHFYWILPIMLMGRNPASQLGDIYSSSASLSFFSFAKMENSISLLHPNWPENLFGKVAFLKPEYLVIPILAFSSLLFLDKDLKKRLSILSLLLISIIGIFLAKGVNDPFGNTYEVLFNVLPGFVMFRDPTKWYIFIAVSFSILIPFTLEKLSVKMKNNGLLLGIIFLAFWAFLLRDSFTGVLKGTLNARNIPSNYQVFANELANDKIFSRTFWVPSAPTWGYVSNNHPSVSSMEFFKAISVQSLSKKLQKPETEQVLRNLSVKYVVVPVDTDKKIFLTDRKYDERVYKKTVQEVKKVGYLSDYKNLSKLIVYEVKNPKDHFWMESGGATITYKYISPTKYEVNIKNAKKGEKIIFTESFDRFWQAEIKLNNTQSSKPYKLVDSHFVNSFVLPETGGYSMVVFYKPQMWLQYGLLVSITSFITVIIIVIRLKK